MNQIGHWLGGHPFEGRSQRRGDVFDPATGEQTAEVALANAADVSEAIAVAVRAFRGWRQTTLAARQQILFDYRELLLKNRDQLAQLITAEHGKTIPDALGEVQRGIEVVDFVCGIPHLLKGEYSQEVSTAVDMHSVRQPLGVTVGITPFNFPAMVPLWMFPVAIACGNSFILKPSEKDPSPALLAARLFSEAGLPDGVLNVINGDRRTVEALLEEIAVAGVSFVGSTQAARAVYSSAAASGKRVQALGGAKNHMVVLPDADLDAAVDAAVSAGYGSAGERCMAISVVVTVGDVADEFVKRLARRTDEVRTGAGQVATSEMGPLVTASHRDNVVNYIRDGVESGAELIVDGRGLTVDGHPDGFWLGPTLFDRVEPDMNIYTDEIFGPVLSVVRRDTLRDAIELVNQNPYGNGTAVFTADGAAARTFEREIEVGMVGINIPIPVPLAFYSFGGWNDSMLGGFDIYGPDGIRFYTRQKTVTSRWNAETERDLGFPAG